MSVTCLRVSAFSEVAAGHFLVFGPEEGNREMEPERNRAVSLAPLVSEVPDTLAYQNLVQAKIA